MITFHQNFDSYGIHDNGETVRVGPRAHNRMEMFTPEGKPAELRAISARHGAIYVTEDGEIVTQPHLSESELAFLKQALGIQEVSREMRIRMEAAGLW